MKAEQIVGGNGANKRRALDFYPTPPEVTQALLDTGIVPRYCTIWEPACGDGDMVRVLEANGYKTVGTDIRTGTDFLDQRLCGGDWIITNPPFSLAEQFVRKACEFGKPFAMLLKSQYWHAASRRKLFENCPPSLIFPLTWRPNFTGQGNSLMDMMWCVWYPQGWYHPCIYRPLERPKEVANGEQ